MIALLLTLAQDAWVVERTATVRARDWLDAPSEIRGRQVVTIAGENVRFDDLTWGTAVLILPGEEKIYRMDPHLGQYTVWTFAEVRAAWERQKGEIEGVLARVAGSSDEADLRRILTVFNAVPGEGDVTVETGESDPVAGRDARQIVVRHGPRTILRVSVWEGGPSYLPALSAIGAFSPDVAARLADVRGLPLAGTERYVLLDRSVVVDFTTTLVEQRAVDPLMFRVPETYRQVPP